MFIIGIDPHKASHTATVIDGDEQLLDELRLRADCHQRARLLAWAAKYSPRVWAVEGASGTGALLAQQLVSAGETVVDMPAALSARVRLLDAGRKDKTDAHDARSEAIVALRHRNLHEVIGGDHVQVLRLLARRHHQLIAGRTRAICRLHALLATMVAGGLPPKLRAKRAAAELGKIRPADAVGRERKHIAVEFLDEVRRHDRALGELEQRVNVAVATANSNVTTVYGVGTRSQQRCPKRFSGHPRASIKPRAIQGALRGPTLQPPTDAARGPHNRGRSGLSLVGVQTNRSANCGYWLPMERFSCQAQV